jgi:hypothetical protein
MIAIQNIQQQTEDWFKIKWGKIGGTASAGLLNSTDTLKIDILSQRLEEFSYSEGYKSDDMIRGNELEPFAREYISKYANTNFLEVGWLQSEDNVLIGMSPDGINEDHTIQCEIKCLARKKHTEILVDNQIPKEYLAQCLHAFTINPKLTEFYWIAYRPESIRPFVGLLNRESLLDFSWKKKTEVKQFGVKGNEIKPKIVSEPDIKTIDEWAKISLKAADDMLEEILKLESSLKF